MRIGQLTIDGFRSLKNVTWEPGNLNILIGPNGTGKSNLIRFLELITVAAKGGLGKYVQSLGGMDAIMWDGRAPGVSFTLDCNERFGTPDFYALQLSPTGPTYFIEREHLIAKKLRRYLLIELLKLRVRWKTTHSPQLLDAFTDKNPTTTVTKWVGGETVLRNLSGDELTYWLKEYTLGTLFKSGELESMA